MILAIKHTLASHRDNKPTITDGEMRKLIGPEFQGHEVDLFYPSLQETITYHSSRGGKSWYANQPPVNMCLPQIGTPKWYDVIYKLRLLEDELLPIRQWAFDKGILTNGKYNFAITKNRLFFIGCFDVCRNKAGHPPTTMNNIGRPTKFFNRFESAFTKVYCSQSVISKPII